MWLKRSLLTLTVGLIFLSIVPPAVNADSQAVQDPPAKPEPTFFFMSGTVSELSKARITITRVAAGRTTEKHAFLLTAETTVEGKLRLKARVTIGYVKGEDDDTAVRIIVRAAQRPRH